MEIQFQMEQNNKGQGQGQGYSSGTFSRNATNKSKFVGVRQRPSGKWVAEIKNTTQKIRMWLGTFDTPEEAARAYDEAACLLRGANTRTNFIDHLPSNSPLSMKIRNLLNQKKGLNPNSHNFIPTTPTKKTTSIQTSSGYKPELINGQAQAQGSDHSLPLTNELPKRIEMESNNNNNVQLPDDFEWMKVERQISASLYAMNGVNEYWENVHDSSSSDAFWDLPMLCQMF